MKGSSPILAIFSCSSTAMHHFIMHDGSKALKMFRKSLLKFPYLLIMGIILAQSILVCLEIGLFYKSPRVLGCGTFVIYICMSFNNQTTLKNSDFMCLIELDIGEKFMTIDPKVPEIIWGQIHP